MFKFIILIIVIITSAILIFITFNNIYKTGGVARFVLPPGHDGDEPPEPQSDLNTAVVTPVDRTVLDYLVFNLMDKRRNGALFMWDLSESLQVDGSRIVFPFSDNVPFKSLLFMHVDGVRTVYKLNTENQFVAGTVPLEAASNGELYELFVTLATEYYDMIPNIDARLEAFIAARDAGEQDA